MKVALVTTTIRVPEVLRLYRKLDPYVGFFIATDDKSPHKEICAFADEIGNTLVRDPATHDGMYACSKLIGRNTVARRSCAILDALQWGATLIISIDDDNIPINRYGQHFFTLWRELPGTARWFHSDKDIFGSPYFEGLEIRSPAGWFDPGSFQFPLNQAPVVQRGFPQAQYRSPGSNWHVNETMEFVPVTDAKIGVAQGMILGDPDTSAVDRISRHPVVHQVSEVLRAGIVTSPRSIYAPLNSQNLAFIRELAPCFLFVPQFGRYDDIYASLVAQRVMHETGHYVHFGQPFVWQQRNEHNLLQDLKAEMWGMEHILEFTSFLDSLVISGSVLNNLLLMVNSLPIWLGEDARNLWVAWLEDCAKVLG